MSLSDDYRMRFGGIGRLYGEAALERIAASHVAVVGVGGVGSWTVEALARSGVGALTLIDLDEICINNTNRQLHTLDSTLGQAKVEAMAARVRQINPECVVRVVADFYTPQTRDVLLDVPYDYVVDAIDHVAHKCDLIAECVARSMPIVAVGGAGGRRDATQLKIDDLSRSGGDGLLRQARRVLRQQYGFATSGEWGVPCVFSREAAVYPTPEGEVCDTPSTTTSSVRLDCAAGFGAATFVTGTAGFMAAGVVIEALAAALRTSALTA